MPAIKAAIKYATRLQALLSDQYEIDVYKNKEEQLKNLLTEGKRHEFDGRVMKVIEILSPILLVFGFLYLLGGAHPNEWDNNALLKFFPDAHGILIIPFRLFWVLILPVLTVNGKFGLELITAAYACRSFYKAKQYTKIKNVVSTVSKFVIAAIIVWHLLLIIIEGKTFVEGVVFFVIAVIVCRVFGFIISKMIVAVSNAKTVGKKVGLSIAFVVALVVINVFSARIPAINENVRESAVKTEDTAKVSDSDNKIQSFTVELVNEDTSDFQAIDVASVEADSVLVSSKGNRYEPKFMIDGDTTTSWQEGEDGAGEGQVFLAKFGDNQKVDYVVIHNGNHKSEKLYYNNNRIKSLNITINDQSANIELEDSMDPQVIRINGAESINEVRFEIVSVYSGDKYNDTCVAEVQFLCR